MNPITARDWWSQLAAVREPLIRRVERYASLTIPKIMLPEGFVPEDTDQTHDFQSIGAQAVNHVVNKLVMSLFRPSAPFFRTQLGADSMAEALAAGVPEHEIQGLLAGVERRAAALLDERAQRPRMYTLLRHLVIAGQALIEFQEESMRVYGLRYWCVKRNQNGDIHTLVIQEKIKFNELVPEVQAALPKKIYHADSEVEFYKLLRRDIHGDLHLSQWVDEQRLPPQFDGKWPADDCPFHIVTWDLADESDYATGLVEEYAGDLEALSVLAEAVVDGAVLGCEYRWLVSATGQTNPQELEQSKNGAALAGNPQDVNVVQGGNPTAVTVALEVSQTYEQRIARGFLLNSATTRDAERVTAEEIRLVAQELETSFGGVYSALAIGIQRPVAKWLLKGQGVNLKGLDLQLVIISGLDALSRNSDLEALRLALGDLAQVAALPPMLQARLKMDALAAYIGQGRGVDLAPFLMSDAEFQQQQQAAQADRVAESNAMAAGEAAAQGAVQQ